MEGKSNVDSAEPVGLVPASFQIHARKLLHQLLKDASIPDHVFREEQVFAVLADAVKKLDPDVQHGADMDLRNGLKVKPITRDGLASPAWVDGLLYAADVPLKWESQIVLDARILVLNFGIIPAEEEQALTTFNNLVGREAEHVSKLVDSIVRLHPTLLLVKGNVTSDAINSLRQSGVAVAHNIKASILQEVSAVTGATVVTSANQLSNSQISLGGCRRFEAKKYRLKGVKRQYFMFKDIPGGSVGTIALRGNDEKLLKRMKSVMMTMAYAMYNMKLERSLLVDQFASLSVFLGSMGLGKAPGLFMGPNQASDDISLQHTKLITPPPIPTTKSTSCLLDTGSTSSRLDSNVTGTDDIICISVSPFVLNTPPVDLPSQYTSKNDDKPDFEPLRDAAINEVSRKEGNDSKGNKGKSKMDQNEKTFDLVTPEMLHNPAVIPAGSFKCRPVLRKALKVKCQRDLEDHQRRLMRSRGLVHGNDGDSNLSFTDEFVVIYHSLNTETSSCCTGAETIVIKFYKQKAEKNKTFHPDLPLGQYIENLVDNVNSPCKSVDCNDPIGDHQRRYVHGRAKITVSVNVHPSKLHGAEDEILMWNCCRLCERETPAISMSTDTWKYSFGQYLQLSFCCRKLFTDHLHCTHDLHRDYLRYFGYKGLAIEFAYEPLDLFGVAVPPTQVCWDVEKDLILRNELYATAESQIDRFFRSVRSRIHSVRSQNQKTVKSNEFSAKLYRLLALAKGDQHVLKRKLEDVYARTEYYDTLSFNITISSLQEKALSWEATFENVENELLSTIRELSNNVACESPKGDDELITRSTQENPDDILKNSTIQEPQTAPNNDFEAVEKDVDDNNRENSVSQRSRGHFLDKGERPNDNDYDVAASKSLPATSPPPWSKPTSPVDDNQQAHTTKRKSAYSYEEDRGRPAPRPERRLKPNDPRPPASIDDILNASEQDTNATHSNIGRRRPRSRSRFRSKLRSLLSPTRRRRGSPDPNVPPIPTSEPTTSVDGTFKQKNTPFDFSPPNSTSTVGPPSPDVINTDRTKGSRVSGMLGRLRRELKPDKLAAQERWPRLMPTKRLASTTSEFSIDDAMTPTGSQERTTGNNAGDPVKKSILEKQPAATPSTALCDEHTKDIKDHTDGKDKSDNTVAEIEKHPNGTEETRNPRMDPTQDLQKEKIDVQKAEVLPAMDQPLNAEIPAYGNDDNASDNGNDSDRSVEQSEETQRQEQPQHTITSLITSFFSDRTENALTPLDYPLRTIDHLFVDTNIIVREDEPTSFIALSLGTEEYKEKLEKSNLNNKQEKRVCLVNQSVFDFHTNTNAHQET